MVKNPAAAKAAMTQTIVEKVNAARRVLPWHLQEQAQRVVTSGLSQSTHSRLEAGKAPMRLEGLFALCYSTNMSRPATLRVIEAALEAWEKEAELSAPWESAIKSRWSY